MERRKILLGSGAALATVLAGCTSSKTDSSKSDDSTNPSGGTTDSSDDTNMTGNTTDNTTDNSTNSGAGDSGSESESGTGHGHEGESDGGHDNEDQTIPGFKQEKLNLKSDLVSIADISRNGDTVNVHAHTKTKDKDKLHGELDSIVDDFKAVVVDPSAFAEAISTVRWQVGHQGSSVTSFYVKVDWVIKHMNGKMSKKKLINRILETAE